MRAQSLFVSALLPLSFSFLSTATQAGDPVWLQIAPGGKLLARTVVDGTCPPIIIDGKAAPMLPRAGSDKADEVTGFRLSCQAEVTTARTAVIKGVKLPLPEAVPKRILVLGDTGCRIKAEADEDDEPGAAKVEVQDCNDPKAWPFAQVAAVAAAEKPDLIIHVGDYLYRESKCPTDKEKDCGGSPWGDNWQTWDADFFTPADPLLKAAPWIFVRGNHEICSRAGSGWNYYLDGAPFSPTCSDHDAPWAVHLGRFQAWVIDSSAAPDNPPTPAKAQAAAKEVSEFVRQFQAAKAEHLEHAWLISHRPVWGIKAGGKHERDQLRTLNETLQQAWAIAPIPGVDLVLSGHIHLFEALALKGGKPPAQLILGDGSTKLAHDIKSVPKDFEFGGVKVADATVVDQFGYAVMEPDADTWKLKLKSRSGKTLSICTVDGGKTHCK